MKFIDKISSSKNNLLKALAYGAGGVSLGVGSELLGRNFASKNVTRDSKTVDNLVSKRKYKIERKPVNNVESYGTLDTSGKDPKYIIGLGSNPSIAEHELAHLDLYKGIHDNFGRRGLNLFSGAKIIGSNPLTHIAIGALLRKNKLSLPLSALLSTPLLADEVNSFSKSLKYVKNRDDLKANLGALGTYAGDAASNLLLNRFGRFLF